jgi:hypothetical protein
MIDQIDRNVKVVIIAVNAKRSTLINEMIVMNEKKLNE